MSTRLSFVVLRSGGGIPDATVALGLSMAKALLAVGCTVEVLTTCVQQFYSDWNCNFHPEGRTVEGGVPVRRFPVRPRDVERFDRVNSKLMRNLPVTPDEEQIFVTEMINSPSLYEYISRHSGEAFVFVLYMFGTTYWGSMVCPERSVVIPCLHDEAYARMQPFRNMCERVRGLVFNSLEEQRLAQRVYSLNPDRLAVVGVPVDCTLKSDPARFRRQYGMSDFFLYAGRTDKGKGAELLVEYYCRLLDDTNAPEQLVFIGGGELEVPQRYQSRIVKLGFLPLQDKHDAYGAAIALCVPSNMESFSIVTMESWLAGRPVVVNAQCAVTEDFCLQSDGGLSFSDYAEFRETLEALARDPILGVTVGAQGREFVLRSFHPRLIATKYVQALEAWGLR